MRRTQFVAAALVVCAAVGLSPVGSAQNAARPTIFKVAMTTAGDLLIISGTGFGPAPVVTIDGEPVPVLAGSTDTQVTVPTPAVLLTTPGTYRLTVVDSVRQLGEVFVVASRAGLEPAMSLTTGGTAATPSTPSAATVPPRATGAAAAISSVYTGGPVGTFAIEDSVPPYRTAFGYEALFSNTTGDYNTATGYHALFANTSGAGNTALGAVALRSNTTGTYNTATGYQALLYNNSDASTATGYQALLSNTTGRENTAIGFQALFANTQGEYNTAIGSRAMLYAAGGSRNTAIGVGALWNNGSSYNTAIGVGALGGAKTTGCCNTAIGGDALVFNTTGLGNTAVGEGALDNNTTGLLNTALGSTAGFRATTGNYNLFLGANVLGATGDTNTIRIGNAYNGGDVPPSGQNRTFIAGIRGTSVSGGLPVVIDANGQLGTASASGLTFPTGGNVAALTLQNATAGPANYARMDIKTDAAGGRGLFDAYSSTFASSGNSVAGGVSFTAIGPGGFSIALQDPAAPMRFYTGPVPSEQMRIDASGNVGIGTTAPGYLLDVASRMRVRQSGANTAGIWFYQTAPANDQAFIGMATDHQFGLFGNTGAAWGIVMDTTTGNVGVGTLSPSNPLEMASGAYVSPGGVWTNASSRSYKDHIAELPADRAIDTFAQLKPVTFTYKANGEAHVGFIAEDVPDLVATPDRKSLSAMDIVAVLTRVAQEQQATIVDLQARLVRLEALLATAAGGQ